MVFDQNETAIVISSILFLFTEIIHLDVSNSMTASGLDILDPAVSGETITTYYC